MHRTVELVQHLLLERTAGYEILRAHGEQIFDEHERGPLRWWLLICLPALVVSSPVTSAASRARSRGAAQTR